MKYWDKFVRRKTKQKFRDQVDEAILDALLGEEKAAGDTSFDYRFGFIKISAVKFYFMYHNFETSRIYL